MRITPWWRLYVARCRSSFATDRQTFLCGLEVQRPELVDIDHAAVGGWMVVEVARRILTGSLLVLVTR
jgi:hypothetical protein